MRGESDGKQAHAYLSGLLFLFQLPARRRRDEGVPRGLHIHQCAGSDAAAVDEALYGAGPQVAGKRGIDEHQIPGIAGLGQHDLRRAVVHLCALRVEQVQLLAQHLCRAAIELDKIHRCRAAAQGLQSECAGPGEQVQAAGTGQVELQPVEQCLPQPVARGAQSLDRREGHFAPAPAPADDAQLGYGAGAGSGLRMWGFFGHRTRIFTAEKLGGGMTVC